MRYLSLFSGIEACTVAWHELGWTPVAFCEFDKFPSEALQHHYPDVVNLGDVTQITDEMIQSLGPIDVVVGGSPCQDLSIAGNRAGLDGERSGLFHEQMRIFNAARTFCGARWLLWENVPGAFSSNKGKDFAVVVGAMAGCDLPVARGGWKNTGVALGENGLCEWSVLDAQWFGVPQRRRRVFALLDTGDWSSRPPILFEPEGLLGDTPPSRETGQETTRESQAGFRMRGFGDYDEDESGSALKSRDYKDATDLVTIAFKERAGKPGGGKGFLGKTECECTLSTTNDQNIMTGMAVRRLTLLERERLQGFPDGYTDIRDKTPDGPRYKALGNSMAVPVMRWIGQQIMEKSHAIKS